jgi:hypothetical protein
MRKYRSGGTFRYLGLFSMGVPNKEVLVASSPDDHAGKNLHLQEPAA